eukprot:3781708-Rhodomonas_salina.1
MDGESGGTVPKRCRTTPAKNPRRVGAGGGAGGLAGKKRMRGDPALQTLPNHIRDAEEDDVSRNLARHAAKLAKLSSELDSTQLKLVDSEGKLSHSRAEVISLVSKYWLMTSEIYQEWKEGCDLVCEQTRVRLFAMRDKIKEVTEICDDLEHSVSNDRVSVAKDPMTLLQNVVRDMSEAQEDLKQKLDDFSNHFNARVREVVQVIRGDSSANGAVS